ncbi:hypothetical protein [Amycolatopsis sp. lyj-112]
MNASVESSRYAAIRIPLPGAGASSHSSQPKPLLSLKAVTE